MPIRATVWGENVHEQKNKVVSGIYPLTMHGTIAEALNRDKAFKVAPSRGADNDDRGGGDGRRRQRQRAS